MVDTRASVYLHGGVVPGWRDFAGGWFGFAVEVGCHVMRDGAVEED